MIIAQTPLRISFVGGGTDFRDYWSRYGGSVVSSTIDKYVYVIVKKRFDDEIIINYTKKERVRFVEEIQHDLVREALKKTGVENGVEITTLADIPSEGSGLGSSSSITVGLLHALYAYQGELVEAGRLAREACEIEIDIVGSPIGIQDQYIAAYGGLRFFEFRQDGTVATEKLRLSDSERRQFGSNLYLFYLNKIRKSNEILAEQKARIDSNVEILHSIKNMVFPFKQALFDRRLDEIGAFLDRAWKEKIKLASNITNFDIERYYKAALKAGALGGKVTGAGGGGFLLLYCQRYRQAEMFKAMTQMGLKELPFKLEPYGSKIIFNPWDTAR